MADLLDGPLLKAFCEQSPADQRHGLDSARHVIGHDGRPELVVAALLHDVGKRHARLGVFGRTVASLLDRLRLPAPGRLGAYLRHGEVGAAELSELGLGGIAVDFTLTHHGVRPPSMMEEDWNLLIAADQKVVGRRWPSG